MSTLVVLLRGINVGGHAPIAMADLRKSLEGLGLSDVRTYLQSGNAVVDVGGDAGTAAGLPTASPAGLAAAMEERIERDLGWRVGVRVLSADEMTRVVAANPCAGEPGIGQRWLHVTFVLGAAAEGDLGATTEDAHSEVYKAAFAKLMLPAAPGERAAFAGAPTLATPVVYLRLPHGYGRSKLNNAYFERSLGAAATTRNWRTVRALAELSGDETRRGAARLSPDGEQGKGSGP